MSLCDKCVTDKSLCDQCKDNPKYANVPKSSAFMPYKPVCKIGAVDCINDPAYILYTDPVWYKELYGDKTPEELALECFDLCYDAEHDEVRYYDDEDK